MSSELALTLLYDMVNDMTVLNGFNYDWIVRKGGDKFLSVKKDQPSITIRMGSEDNADDRGGVGSGEYIDDMNIYITGKVSLNRANVSPSDVTFEEELALSKAKDDIKTRFDSEAYLCNGGLKARSLKYLGSDPLEKESEQKYSPMRIECRFNLKYVTERKLLDKRV